MSKALKLAENYLAQLATGNFTVDIDPRLLNQKNDVGRLARQIQKISDGLKEKTSTLESLAKGKIPSSKPQSDDPIGHATAQIISNISKLAAENRTVKAAVSEGNLDVRAQVEQLPGFYREIGQALNDNLDTVVVPVRQVHHALSKMTLNDYSSHIDGNYQGELKVLTDNTNTLCERLTALAASIEKIARGDTTDLEKYQKIGKRSDVDRMIPAMLLATQNIQSLVATISDVAQNVEQGNVFGTKADLENFEGGYRDILEGVNHLLHAFTAPLSATLEELSFLAVNDYTHDINQTTQGDFAILSEKLNSVLSRLRYLQVVAQKVSQGDIGELENLRRIGKRSENDHLVPSFTRMMESIQGLIDETGNIANATSSGNFSYTCNTNQFQGEFKKIIATFEACFKVMAGFVKEITKVMQSMSEGNLHVTAGTSYNGQLKTLAESVNLTSHRLGTTIDDITGALTQISEGNLAIDNVRDFRGDFSAISTAINTILLSLNNLLSQINISSNQVSAGSSQVSAASQSLSQGAAEQASSVEELTSSITEVAAQVRENAENAKQVKEISDRVRENAREGDHRMKLMLDSMNEINEGSSNISKVIKVIDDIAFQTNILALNAAVEAARAGQAGKGFAVVADEVRNLAAKSANAAKETTGLIEGNIKKVEAGTKIANETAVELDVIVKSIEETTSFINNIAAASNQQATAISQIDTGIEQVSTVVQTNSATAEESAASSEELSGQAESLKQLVNQFKLRDEDSGSTLLSDAAKSQRPAEKNLSKEKSQDSVIDLNFGKY